MRLERILRDTLVQLVLYIGFHAIAPDVAWWRVVLVSLCIGWAINVVAAGGETR